MTQTLEASFREIENIWITMPDGCNLAAKIWLPEDAEKYPVPAIIEYIPYRKRDFKALRDSRIHRYFAQHGYACLRVDLRGSGDSEGILKDEYLNQELKDGIDILKWTAAQSWCTGKIGMIGISWGGFNGLQIAAMNPPELKAIITVCSSDDRYTDDVHYMGGCMLTDNLSWASTMFSYNSLPPDPAIVGERWKDMWLERLEGSGLWIKKWLSHQTRDDYWKHASVAEDYEAIKCPVFAVSGWADGYSNTVFRLMEHLNVPGKALIGGWGHKYPHLGGPGPAIDFLNEAVKWWDKWLKDIDEGENDEPLFRAWMQDSISPIVAKRPGWWVAEDQWPSPRIRMQEFVLSPGKIHLEPEEIDEGEMRITSPLSVGLFAGKWYSYSESTDLPNDQSEEDGGALVFDSPELEEDIEILGAPEIELEISSDKPIAMIAIRLNDVCREGISTRVTYGLLNLTHRDSHEHPQELKVDHTYKIRMLMNHVAQRFPAGNKIRVAISTSYWPLAWPSPEPPSLTIRSGGKLFLPIRPPSEMDSELTDLGEPVFAEPVASTLLEPAHREWTVTHNLATNDVTQRIINNDARIRLDDIDLEIKKDTNEIYMYCNNNYATLRGEVVTTRSLKRKDWHTTNITRTVLTSTKTHFCIRATLDAYEGDARIFSKSWDERIPRQMM
ncbi:CocE/NonD family hydrolase [Methanolobus bombayensis]|uniref:CocE/NonD family hydrolase n=1 Tax=Methanolobus bombayensis TaxID=38023 RepID=UPI001AE33C0B|nr:CocE/NonD family hydrolase [Methanolobus bombayensis]MBP1908288.1 putative CocE/NonD family hydrolase [Methanolobus bombayensis]